MISEEKLRFWYKNNFNVLIEGRHGVGKSSCVTNFLDGNNINYMYFSCGTMDPWVDFVGVPKEKESENGSYLDLVRPKPLQEDNVEVMVFDEFNRAKSKVKNAVLELVQFKSINGKKFENLKVIWALINPSEDEEFDYDVEPLAPAQKDRFHVQVEVPYRPNKKWFIDNFGEAGAGAVGWWKSLPKEKQREVTPRRLEYALEMLILDGSVRDVFPEGINVTQFRKQVDVGDITKKLIELQNKSEKEIERFFEDQNNYFNTIDTIKENEELVEKYVPYMPKEKVSQLVQKDQNILRHVVKNKENVSKYENLIGDIYETHNSNSELKNKLHAYDTAFNDGDPLKYQNYIYYEPSNQNRIEQTVGSDKTTEEVRKSYKLDFDDAVSVMNDQKSNTNQRKREIKDLCKSFYVDEINTDLLIKTIKEPLDKFVGRSRFSTVNSFDYFSLLFNSCFKEIVEDNEISSEDFLKTVMSSKIGRYIDSSIEKDEEIDLCIIIDKWC